MLRALLVVSVVSLSGLLAIAAGSPNKSTGPNAVAEDGTRPTTEVQTFQIKGMHCEGCAKTLNTAVCKPGKYKDCYVSLIDEKAELGQIRITPNPGQIINIDKIRKQVSDAGYELQK